MEPLKKQYDLTDEQLKAYIDYFHAQKAEEVDKTLVREFEKELNDTSVSNILTKGNSSHIQIILELKNCLHRLQHRKTVERTLKLWGHMRLQIRDRNLKEKISEIKDLKRKISKLTSALEDSKMEISELKKEVFD
eukprot:UN26095